MNDDLAPNPEAIRAFLAEVVGGDQFVLTAIPVDGGRTDTETFDDAAGAARWAADRNGPGGMNLYWTVNTVRRAMQSKPKKEDMDALRFLHVDVDPNKSEDLVAARNRIIGSLEVFEPRPSFVISSGGGAQAFWRLDEPFYLGGGDAQIAVAEAYNRQLAADLGGDHCFNVDRVMRLPGTVNWPGEKKRLLGRSARVAELVGEGGLVYPLASFTPALVERETPKSGARGSRGQRPELRRLSDPTELEQWGVPLWVHAVIVEGTDPTDPDRWGGDRSAAVFAVVCQLARCGTPSELTVGILTDRTWGISAHVLAQSRALDYAWRQVERAYREVEAEGEPFQTDKDGKRLATQHNVRLALSKMGVSVRFDTFADRPTLEGLPGFGPHLDDAAMSRLWLRVIEEHHIKVGKDFFWTVVEDAAKRDDFHPVVEYLGSLQWDGVERLDRWMPAYLGADDTEYTRHVGAIMLTAAVRRVRSPGCKFDEMVVLESEQGKSKSTALSLLAVREDWFSDDLPLGAESKVVIERTQGRWVIEAAELAGMGKKTIESLKAFLSRRVDRSRMAYGRLPHEAPRHFIVVGTTNDDRYLSDSTGNRRFWPVRVGDIDLEGLERDRDQLWAEAAAREAAGTSIRLDRALWQAAAVQQDERRVIDPFVDVLADVFGCLNGKVLSRDVWNVIGTPAERRTSQLEVRLGSSMRELGFEHDQRRFGGNPQSCYVRGTKEERMRRIVVSCDTDENGKSLGPWTARLEGSRGEQAEFELPDHGGPY